MKNITPIIPFESISSWNQGSGDARKKRNPKKKKRESSVKKHFFAISRLIDENQLSLLAKKSPFRLSVYQKKDDILMDITTINKTKKTDQFFNRAITHDDVRKVVRRIHSGMGFIVDYSV